MTVAELETENRRLRELILQIAREIVELAQSIRKRHANGL